MAFTTLIMENPHTGAIREAPVGFSWTTFFFTFFVPFFRGDYKWGIIQFFLACITWGLSVFVFIFLYNKLYIKDLIGEGFKVKSSTNGDLDYVSSKIGLTMPMLEPTVA